MATLSSTLAVARLGMAQVMGEVVTGTTTNAGDTTSLLDATNLVHYGNDKFNNWWILLTSGTYSGSIVRVTDFAQATGDCTFTPALAGNVGNGVTYELHKYHPTNQIRWALNKALQMSHPELRKEVTCDDLVAGNWLPNGSFEDWTAATNPDLWALTTSTSSKSTRGTAATDWYWGNSGLALGGATGYLSCHQGLWPPLMDLLGKTVRFEGWLKTASVTTSLLLHVYTTNTGTDTLQGSSNAGTTNLLSLLRTDEITLPAPTTADGVQFRISQVTSASPFYDNVRLIGPPCYVYALPLAFQHKDPEEVWIQTGGWNEGNERPCDDRGDTYPYTRWPFFKVEYDNVLGLRLLRMTQAPPIGYRIRLRGSEYMATVTSDTDVMPLNPPQLNVLYPLAAREMFESMAMNVGVTSSAGKEYLDQAAFMNNKWEREKVRAGQKLFSMGINYGEHWRY